MHGSVRSNNHGGRQFDDSELFDRLPGGIDRHFTAESIGFQKRDDLSRLLGDVDREDSDPGLDQAGPILEQRGERLDTGRGPSCPEIQQGRLPGFDVGELFAGHIK